MNLVLDWMKLPMVPFHSFCHDCMKEITIEKLYMFCIVVIYEKMHFFGFCANVICEHHTHYYVKLKLMQWKPIQSAKSSGLGETDLLQ